MTNGPQPQRPAETLSWRILRRPPIAALAVGALSSLLAGLFVIWNVAVMLRVGKVVAPKIRARIPSRRPSS